MSDKPAQRKDINPYEDIGSLSSLLTPQRIPQFLELFAEGGKADKALTWLAGLGQEDPIAKPFLKVLGLATKGAEYGLTGIFAVPQVARLLGTLGKDAFKGMLKQRKENKDKSDAELEEIAKKVLAEAAEIQKYQEFLTNTETTEILLPQQQELISNFFTATTPSDEILREENIYGWLYIKPEDGADKVKFDAAIVERKARTAGISKVANNLITDQTNKELTTQNLVGVYAYLADPTMDNPAGLSESEKATVKADLGITDFKTDAGKISQILADLKKIFGLMDKAGTPFDFHKVIQKVEAVALTADLLTAKPGGLTAYNEIWLTGAAHTIAPLNAGLGRKEAIPKDIQDEFRTANVSSGENPFLALGFLTPPTPKQITDKLADLNTKNTKLPNEATLKISIDKFKAKGYSKDEVEQNTNILTALDKNQVEMLGSVSKIYQEINNNPRTGSITFEYNGISINITNPGVITAIKQLLFTLDATGAIQPNLPVKFDESAFNNLLSMPAAPPAYKQEAVKFFQDVLIFKNARSQISSIIFENPKSTLNFINDMEPNFEMIYEALDGDLAQLNTIWNLNSATPKNVSDMLKEKFILKLQICNKLNTVAATPDYEKVKAAHKKHLLKIIDGEICLLGNLVSSSRDPNGYVDSIKQTLTPLINTPIYKTIMQNEGIADFDNDLLETPVLDKTIAIDKLSNYPDIANLKSMMEKAGRIVLARFNDIISQYPDDMGNAPQDIQEEILELNNIIQMLVTLGFNVSTVEINEKMFKMYLNGMLNYPSSIGDQKLVNSLGTGPYKLQMMQNKITLP